MGKKASQTQNLGVGTKRVPVVHSRCTQVRVQDVCKSAVSVFSAKSKNGEIPLVIIPSARMSSSLMMQVPSGVTCLIQKWGKATPDRSFEPDDPDQLKPGLHILPAYWRIAYCVSQQSNTYDAPVIACPTADDVRVNIDVVLIFKIVDAFKFVYKLGAQNFDDFLAGTVDEAIRMLVRKETHKTVYWLRGEKAGDDMLRRLNQIFEGSGCKFSDVKIVSVWLPDELAHYLENTTMMDKAMDKLKRQNEYEMLKINMENAMQIEEIKRRLEQSLVAETGRAARVELEFDQKKVKTEQDAAVAMIEANARSEVMMLETQTQLNRTKVTLETVRVQEDAKAQEYVSKIRYQAELDEEVRTIQAGWNEEKMLCEAAALTYEAGAEKDAARCLAKKRVHELNLREKTILGGLAGNGNFNLVGTSGDRLVNAVMTGRLAANDEDV